MFRPPIFLPQIFLPILVREPRTDPCGRRIGGVNFVAAKRSSPAPGLIRGSFVLRNRETEFRKFR
jgi:hypothetical protein